MRSGPSSDEAATQGIYDLATWQCGHVLGIMPPKQSSKVVIEPIPLTATTVDIVRLLHPLQVESVSITVQGGKGTATVVLSSTDDAKNACRISSGVILGQPVRIRSMDEGVRSTLLQPSWATVAKSVGQEADYEQNGYRNLYVLNLPLEVSANELNELFGRYGRVVHSVILAMLDTQARRRGFIDMDTPESAQAAMHALNGHIWHGYPIEVSYALVQRSDGCLDDDKISVSSPMVLLQGLLPAATIDADDVRLLVEPHGRIIDMDFPANLAGDTTFSVRLTMGSGQDAYNVCNALTDTDVNGQHLQADRIKFSP